MELTPPPDGSVVLLMQTLGPLIIQYAGDREGIDS